MQVGEVLREIMGVLGWKQAQLAGKIAVSQGTISKWLSGQQTPNLDQWSPVLDLIRADPELAHLRFKVDPSSIAVMGRVGAGAVVEPDIEQIPPEGLYSITLPFPIPAEMIGFVIEGDSMYPYNPGTVIIVYRSQRRDIVHYIGRPSVVLTEDGRRYFKTIMPGSKTGLFRLESSRAAPMHDVSITWVGEVFVTLPPEQVFQVEAVQKPKPKRRQISRNA